MAGEIQQVHKPTPRVVVFADLICPYSFIAQRELDQLVQEYDVQPEWHPHWLHPEVPPEGMPFEPAVDPERRKTTMAWLKEMSPEMAARMRFPDKLQCSFFAFAAMEFARDQGLTSPLVRAIFDALWLDGKDIGLVATLQEAAEHVGLDAGALGRALRDPARWELTLAAVQTARRIGITGTPTIILGRTKITGWHYYEVMQSVMEKQGVLPRLAPAISRDGQTCSLADARSYLATTSEGK